MDQNYNNNNHQHHMQGHPPNYPTQGQVNDQQYFAPPTEAYNSYNAPITGQTQIPGGNVFSMNPEQMNEYAMQMGNITPEQLEQLQQQFSFLQVDPTNNPFTPQTPATTQTRPAAQTLASAQTPQMPSSTKTTIPESGGKSNEDPSVLKNFIKALGQFLRALNYVWPEDTEVKNAKALFDNGIAKQTSLQERVINRWHKDMESYYDACSNKNAKVLLEADIEYLKKFDMSSKFAEIADDPDSLDNIWEYINHMNKYARIYNKIPSKVMSKMETMALDLAKGLNNGEKTWNDVNIFNLGQTVLDGASQEEISHLMANMGEIYNAVGGLDAVKEATGANIKIPQMPNMPGLINMAQCMSKGSGAAPGAALGSMPMPGNIAPPGMPMPGTNQSTPPVSTEQQNRSRYRKGWKPK